MYLFFNPSFVKLRTYIHVLWPTLICKHLINKLNNIDDVIYFKTFQLNTRVHDTKIIFQAKHSLLFIRIDPFYPDNQANFPPRRPHLSRRSSRAAIPILNLRKINLPRV